MNNTLEFFEQSQYFWADEFDSKDLPGSGLKMQVDFLKKLEAARTLAKFPFNINSGYRTIQHNKAVGGSPNSSHLKGWAADIHCTDNRNRFKLIEVLILVGFQRIGIGKTFIHVDNDPDKVDRVIWMY